MSYRGGGQERRSPAALAGGVAAVAVLAPLAVVALPFVRLAYRAPALQVALETADALIALIVAYLVYGRFQLRRRLQELLFVLALVTVAVANLVLTALPDALTLGSGDGASRWGALAARSLGTLLLFAAVLVPAAVMVSRRTAAALAISVAAAVIAVGVAGVVYGALLPSTVDSSLPSGDSSRPLLLAHPVVLGVQAVSAVCYAIAALVLTRQSSRTADELMHWVGAGCVLAAAAR